MTKVNDDFIRGKIEGLRLAAEVALAHAEYRPGEAMDMAHELATEYEALADFLKPPEDAPSEDSTDEADED
jgi:hypothetical protein